MKTIVIGDIHGCHKELTRMISDLKQKKMYDPKKDKLVFLGDYIDRGPDSKGVIKFIKNMQKTNKNVIALKGNHEDMLIDYLERCTDESWLFNGYQSTVLSYGSVDTLINDMRWMQSLPVYHEDDHFIFVHAGINPLKKMYEQSESTMLWARDEFILDDRKCKKTVIFGHTPTELIDGSTRPYITKSGNVCIDTGCVFSGVLTAAIIDSGELIGYYQISRNKNNKLNGRFHKMEVK